MIAAACFANGEGTLQLPWVSQLQARARQDAVQPLMTTQATATAPPRHSRLWGQLLPLARVGLMCVSQPKARCLQSRTLESCCAEGRGLCARTASPRPAARESVLRVKLMNVSRRRCRLKQETMPELQLTQLRQRRVIRRVRELAQPPMQGHRVQMQGWATRPRRCSKYSG